MVAIPSPLAKNNTDNADNADMGAYGCCGVASFGSPDVWSGMLVIKCAACRRKLWKYFKVGKGEVLRCHKDRITRQYDVEEHDGKVWCLCGNPVGIDKGGHFSMIRNAFTYAGTKDPKR